MWKAKVEIDIKAELAFSVILCPLRSVSLWEKQVGESLVIKIFVGGTFFFARTDLQLDEQQT